MTSISILLAAASAGFIHTLLTMCTVVTIGYYGLKILSTNGIERYMHIIAGATICLSGFAILFLDM